MSHHHHLELREVGASYGAKVALEDVSFEIGCGRRLALIGPNGAGKSTLLKILAGLKKPGAGDLFWQGRPLKQWTREIAYLPQIGRHQEGFPVCVREVVEMGRYPHLGLFRSFGREDRERVESAMEQMEISGLAERQIDQLSGGQRQRAFIARALAQDAHVILLDEPFTGLDAESGIHLGETLKDLSGSGHLVIASHHDLHSVTSVFTDVLAIDRRQVGFGEAAEVMGRSEVQDLFRCAHYEGEGGLS